MKTIVITGASRGIGKALAIKLAKKNVNLVLGARNTDRLDELKKKLNRLCNNCDYSKLDVSKEKSIVSFFDKVYKRYKKIDILINSAGIGYYSLIRDTDMEKAKKVFDVNFFGLVLCCREAIKNKMKPGSKIINIASEVAFRGMPTTSIYCASKAAVKSFSECLKLETKKLGIKVLVIYPGYTNTDFHKTSNQQSELKKPILKSAYNVKKLADYILKRIKKNSFENIPFTKGIIIKMMNNFCPGMLDRMLFKKYKKEYL